MIKPFIRGYYPTAMNRRRKIWTAVITPLVALAGLGFAATDHVRGAAFVIQAAGMQGTARTVADWVTDDDLQESDAQIPWRGGTLRARVYAATHPDGPPALLVPGVHAGGIDEPRLIQFARDIASMGRVVVAAELPDLKRYSITPRTTDMIEDAGVWLSTASGFSADGRVGLMGISFAGGLSVVAAGRPSLQDRVAFVLSFGGHGDLPRTLRYLCTGIQPDGGRRPPHDYGVAIILLGVADRIVPDEQAQLLRDAILAFLHASHVDMVDKPKAQIEFARAREMAAQLPEPARLLMAYVNERDVQSLGPILARHAEAMGGDPALSAEKAPVPAASVYLLHGTDDNVIPAVESNLLAASLRRRGGRVHQLATPLITHAEVDRSAAARAIWDLVSFWGNLFDE
jgi:dienelactone hydrolase